MHASSSVPLIRVALARPVSAFWSMVAGMRVKGKPGKPSLRQVARKVVETMMEGAAGRIRARPRQRLTALQPRVQDPFQRETKQRKRNPHQQQKCDRLQHPVV